MSHADDKKITIINTFDNTLNTTLTLTEKPTSLILAGQKIYVLHGEKKSVSVLDPIQNKIIKTITTGNWPVSALVSGSDLFILNKLSNTMTIVNASTYLGESSVKIGNDNGNPSYLAILGNKIFILSTMSSKVTIFDKIGKVTKKAINIHSFPREGLVIEKKLYILHEGTWVMSVIDMSSEKLIWVISLDAPGIAMSYVNKKIYVHHADSAFLSVIDPIKNRISKTLPVPIWSLSSTVLGTDLYINNFKDNTIIVLDTLKDEIKTTITIDWSPISSLAVGKKIYINSSTKNQIGVLYTEPPQLLGIVSQSADGTYGITQNIDISILFDQPLSTWSTMTVELNNNQTVALSTIKDKILSTNYTVKEWSNVADLSVKWITSAKITGKSWLEKTSYTIPTGKNLWDFKNIVIDTVKVLNPTATQTPSVTEENTCKDKLYRRCPIVLDPIYMTQYGDNVLCEGFISGEVKKNPTISRWEVLEIAVNMMRKELSPDSEYANTYSDISSEKNADLIPLIQTALDEKLIYPNGGPFQPTKSVSRIETYALLMKGICLSPEEWLVGEEKKKAIYDLAFSTQLTTKKWNRFRPNRPVTRNEVFLLASQLADWADTNGGCDKLECRK